MPLNPPPSSRTPVSRMAGTRWLILPFLGFLTSCGGPPAATDPGPVAPLVRPVRQEKPAPTGIQPGDKLDVFVMEDETFSGAYLVRSTGHVIIPKLGRIKVGGMSPGAVEKTLAAELEKNTLTKATVLVDRVAKAPGPELAQQPEERARTEIFLTGKVGRPGRYTITAIGNSHPTIHQAILQAGGCTRFAHKRKVHVLRKSRDGRLQRINADLLAIESGQIRDIPLAPGDIVVVPEKVVDFGL